MKSIFQKKKDEINKARGHRYLLTPQDHAQLKILNELSLECINEITFALDTYFNLPYDKRHKEELDEWIIKYLFALD